MNSQERYTLFRLFEQNIDTLQGQTNLPLGSVEP